MKKKIIKIVSAFVLVLGVVFGISLYDEWEGSDRTRSNHSWPDWSHYIRSLLNGNALYTTKGLDRYNAIGAPRINFKQFKEIAGNWPGKVHVLNAENRDFYYLHEISLKTYCLTLNDGQVQPFTSKTLINNVRCRLKRWIDGVTLTPQLADLETEQTILKRLGYNLIRPFPKHWLADWSYVEALVNIFETTPKEDMIFFHCDHGKGRTTTFLTLLDIFHNAQDLSLEDIIKRQFILGGVDLSDLRKWNNGTWEIKSLRSRFNLVSSFYDYMKAPDGYRVKTPWTEWLKVHPKDPQYIPEFLKR